MIRDEALILKEKVQADEDLTKNEIMDHLEHSKIIQDLLVNPKWEPEKFVGLRALEFRLIELSEIPFTNYLDKVQEWLQILIKMSDIKTGFSLRGNTDGLLACHNAIITTILIRMNYKNRIKIDQGINWILKYQNINRNEVCNWEGKDLFTKFGGCMKKVPCYHGVVKSIIALSEYTRKYGVTNEISKKLNRGLEDILKHRIFKRFSSEQPIDDSLLLNFYPFPYRTNIIEILSLLKQNNLLSDSRCTDAINILKSKQKASGLWVVDKTFMKTSWVEFDIPKKDGFWITNYINQII